MHENTIELIADKLLPIGESLIIIPIFIGTTQRMDFGYGGLASINNKYQRISL